MPYTKNTDYKTSKGNVAPDLHWSGKDHAYEARAQLKRKVEKEFSPAVVVRPSTSKYNCHAFGHANRHAWFNEINQFVKDDYYPFTPGTLKNGDIVLYYKHGQLTHSAKIISTNGKSIQKLRSKWGAWPEVEHGKNNVPEIYGRIKYYLRKRGVGMVDKDIELALNERSLDLVHALEDEDKRFSLMLASSPKVALSIIRGLDEITELELHHDFGIDALVENIQTYENPVEENIVPTTALAILAPESFTASLGISLIELQNEKESESGSLTFNELILLECLT